MFIGSKSLLAAASLLALVAQPVTSGAVITNGKTKLGVNDSAELNFTDPDSGFTFGVFREGVGDAISPGCFCEGWGVSTTYGSLSTSGFVNQSSGNGGLTGGTFFSTDSSATSIIGLAGAPITIRHDFGASLSADTFQVNVTITNNGTETARDLTYRRVMDWDVPPTTFNEFVSHGGVEANLASKGGAVKYASNNGFASSDPLSGESFIDFNTVNVDFMHNGPNDHGSLFDFTFGDLAPGESRIFNIFYGSAPSQVVALNQINNLGADVWSLGQSTLGGGGGEDGGEDGEFEMSSSASPAVDEATFFFAFGGVGSVETGLTPEDPLLPLVETGPNGETIFTFPAPTPRRWFDPPFVDGFEYELAGGATFLSVGAPPLSIGFAGPFTISVDGLVVGSILPAEEFFFGAGVTKFTLSGILPYLDIEAPGFFTAFPVFLDFEGTATSLTIRPTIVPDGPSVVPEPATWAMMILGFGFVGAATRRRRRSLVAA